jgi:hypothetical protein
MAKVDVMRVIGVMVVVQLARHVVVVIVVGMPMPVIVPMVMAVAIAMSASQFRISASANGTHQTTSMSLICISSPPWGNSLPPPQSGQGDRRSAISTSFMQS